MKQGAPPPEPRTVSERPRERYKIHIVKWNPEWIELFGSLAAELRGALGDTAIRIDHIGSTAVPGLAAKPIVDIQVSVADLQALRDFAEPLARLGYRFREDNPERTKRYFREPPGARRTHVHVRERGSWHEQWALLFRDYMRAHPSEHSAYVALKQRLAAADSADMEAYTAGKADLFWEIIRRADQWAKDTGWRPGPSDA